MRILRLGPLGITTHRRTFAVGLALLALLAALLLFALSAGKADIGVLDSLRAAVGIPVGAPADFIVGQVRAPRALTAVLVGAMLGLSGAILQSLTRNPLASPDFIGISMGAGTGAVLTIWLVTASSLWVTAAAAAAGALATAALILALSWRRRGIVPLRLILAGIAVGFVAQATTQYLLTRMDVHDAGNALAWLVGTTTGRTWTHVTVAAIVMAVLAPIVLWNARALRTMEMGEDTARGLGIAVGPARATLAVCSVLLAAGAVAVTGPVGFIALVAPALALRVTRNAGATLIPSALMGATLLLAADQLAQQMPATLQFPVGIFTAVVGAPYLLWLVWRASRGGPA
ncbi:FecCD family ABC transporter permease [Demequina lignilytica]|uniref:Iron chelate uptake ABC transporter family permease subunit n=1 Tax=Demequina lignilytica TaxID=3051663 RepID=A0AAW7M2W7_9MICO|nr:MULTISPECIES: iron chelate uptake ABC transporter family permease subunit [unclassified Demequina]MDN4477625.1 iron chelate uptake ABC transporter family permease subunit [Demequina sp. SYSU T00039-1]MDN4483669.1 iron chelate uptake ABC transporter family permease subunit [Demequina sp. SYSU T0a273]MDN4488024.1 iron chelate uptake ABC transporter family permease subunit [Demequina sp. SYSU T00039]MDN4490464.1 iron chelate uptake ABC transporter family permease subunit [Demequina sp. SYSU T00